MAVKPRVDRRAFMGAAAAVSVPIFLPNWVQGAAPSERVRVAAVGVGGRAAGNIGDTAKLAHAQMVALCDVDSVRLGQSKERFKDATTHVDWREMLDKHHSQIDAVIVSTPDHTHAPASMAALQLGKGVYTEKPLTHDVYEARQLRLAAAKANVATQMGIQIHATTYYRTARRIMREGMLGKIKAVYVWSGKGWGGGERPTKSDPIPENLSWDHWLGTAPERPYAKDVYHPFNWRKWLDFGTGTLGDMGCHIMDSVYAGLGAPDPVAITSKGPAPFAETYPLSSEIHYTLKGNELTAGDTVPFIWFDGGSRPPAELLEPLGIKEWPGQASFTLGTEGSLMLPHVGAPKLYPVEKFPADKYPTEASIDHHDEWIAAIRGSGKAPGANFDFAGRLTELVLLGTVAMRFPNQELKWDAANLAVTNVADANRHLRRTYRKGWEVSGL